MKSVTSGTILRGKKSFYNPPKTKLRMTGVGFPCQKLYDCQWLQALRGQVPYFVVMSTTMGMPMEDAERKARHQICVLYST